MPNLIQKHLLNKILTVSCIMPVLNNNIFVGYSKLLDGTVILKRFVNYFYVNY